MPPLRILSPIDLLTIFTGALIVVAFVVKLQHDRLLPVSLSSSSSSSTGLPSPPPHTIPVLTSPFLLHNTISQLSVLSPNLTFSISPSLPILFSLSYDDISSTVIDTSGHHFPVIQPTSYPPLRDGNLGTILYQNSSLTIPTDDLTDWTLTFWMSYPIASTFLLIEDLLIYPWVGTGIYNDSWAFIGIAYSQIDNRLTYYWNGKNVSTVVITGTPLILPNPFIITPSPDTVYLDNVTLYTEVMDEDYIQLSYQYTRGIYGLRIFQNALNHQGIFYNIYNDMIPFVPISGSNNALLNYTDTYLNSMAYFSSSSNPYQTYSIDFPGCVEYSQSIWFKMGENVGFWGSGNHNWYSNVGFYDPYQNSFNTHMVIAWCGIQIWSYNIMGIEPNKWTHLAMVYQHENNTIYVDGIQVWTGFGYQIPQVFPYLTGTFQISLNSQNSPLILSNINVYCTALTDSQILSDMSSFATPQPKIMTYEMPHDIMNWDISPMPVWTNPFLYDASYLAAFFCYFPDPSTWNNQDNVTTTLSSSYYQIYIDQTNGLDSNNGFSPSTALQTPISLGWLKPLNLNFLISNASTLFNSAIAWGLFSKVIYSAGPAPTFASGIFNNGHCNAWEYIYNTTNFNNNVEVQNSNAACTNPVTSFWIQINDHFTCNQPYYIFPFGIGFTQRGLNPVYINGGIYPHNTTHYWIVYSPNWLACGNAYTIFQQCIDNDLPIVIYPVQYGIPYYVTVVSYVWSTGLAAIYINGQFVAEGLGTFNQGWQSSSSSILYSEADWFCTFNGYIGPLATSCNGYYDHSSAYSQWSILSTSQQCTPSYLCLDIQFCAGDRHFNQLSFYIGNQGNDICPLIIRTYDCSPEDTTDNVYPHYSALGLLPQTSELGWELLEEYISPVGVYYHNQILRYNVSALWNLQPSSKPFLNRNPLDTSSTTFYGTTVHPMWTWSFQPIVQGTMYWGPKIPNIDSPLYPFGRFMNHSLQINTWTASLYGSDCCYGSLRSQYTSLTTGSWCFAVYYQIFKENSTAYYQYFNNQTNRYTFLRGAVSQGLSTSFQSNTWSTFATWNSTGFYVDCPTWYATQIYNPNDPSSPMIPWTNAQILTMDTWYNTSGTANYQIPATSPGVSTWDPSGQGTCYANGVMFFLNSGKNNILAMGLPEGAIQQPTLNGGQVTVMPLSFLSSNAAYTTNNPSLSHPLGIAMDSEGNFYVVDTGNNRIIQFSNVQIALLYYTTTSPSLNSPSGVAIDSSSSANIYVADTGNNRIVKFSPNGTFITSYTASLNHPMAIAVDSNSLLYIADTGNNRIVTYNQTTQSIVNIFTLSSSLNSPQGIAVDVNLNIYIADTGNNRSIQISSTGTLLVTYTTSSPSIAPVSIALGQDVNSNNVWDGNVWSADPTNNRVIAWSNSGTLLGLSLTTGLNQPRGVALGGCPLVQGAQLLKNNGAPLLSPNPAAVFPGASQCGANSITLQDSIHGFDAPGEYYYDTINGLLYLFPWNSNHQNGLLEMSSHSLNNPIDIFQDIQGTSKWATFMNYQQTNGISITNFPKAGVIVQEIELSGWGTWDPISQIGVGWSLYIQGGIGPVRASNVSIHHSLTGPYLSNSGFMDHQFIINTTVANLTLQAPNGMYSYLATSAMTCWVCLNNRENICSIINSTCWFSSGTTAGSTWNYGRDSSIINSYSEAVWGDGAPFMTERFMINQTLMGYTGDAGDDYAPYDQWIMKYMTWDGLSNNWNSGLAATACYQPVAYHDNRYFYYEGSIGMYFHGNKFMSVWEDVQGLGFKYYGVQNLATGQASSEMSLQVTSCLFHSSGMNPGNGPISTHARFPITKNASYGRPFGYWGSAYINDQWEMTFIGQPDYPLHWEITQGFQGGCGIGSCNEPWYPGDWNIGWGMLHYNGSNITNDITSFTLEPGYTDGMFTELIGSSVIQNAALDVYNTGNNGQPPITFGLTNVATMFQWWIQAIDNEAWIQKQVTEPTMWHIIKGQFPYYFNPISIESPYSPASIYWPAVNSFSQQGNSNLNTSTNVISYPGHQAWNYIVNPLSGYYWDTISNQSPFLGCNVNTTSGSSWDPLFGAVFDSSLYWLGAWTNGQQNTNGCYAELPNIYTSYSVNWWQWNPTYYYGLNPSNNQFINNFCQLNGLFIWQGVGLLAYTECQPIPFLSLSYYMPDCQTSFVMNTDTDVECGAGYNPYTPLGNDNGGYNDPNNRVGHISACQKCGNSNGNYNLSNLVGKWAQFAFTNDAINDQITFYINGVLQWTVPGVTMGQIGGSSGLWAVLQNGRKTSGIEFYGGILTSNAILTMYNEALSQLYNGPISYTPISSNLYVNVSYNGQYWWNGNPNNPTAVLPFSNGTTSPSNLTGLVNISVFDPLGTGNQVIGSYYYSIATPLITTSWNYTTYIYITTLSTSIYSILFHIPQVSLSTGHSYPLTVVLLPAAGNQVYICFITQLVQPLVDQNGNYYLPLYESITCTTSTGNMPLNTWHTLSFLFNNTIGTISTLVDGVSLGTLTLTNMNRLGLYRSITYYPTDFLHTKIGNKYICPTLNIVLPFSMNTGGCIQVQYIHPYLYTRNIWIYGSS